MLILTAIATDVHIRISSYCVKRQLWVSVIRSPTYECFSSRWQGRQKERVTTAIPDEKAWEHLLIDVHICNLWTTAYVILQTEPIFLCISIAVYVCTLYKHASHRRNVFRLQNSP